MNKIRTYKKQLYFFSILIFCILLSITVWLVSEIYQEKKLVEKYSEAPYTTNKILEVYKTKENVGNNVEQKEEKRIEEQHDEVQPEFEISENKILEKYNGYEVEAKLEIPSINLETYVIKPYSKQSLNVSVTKFWGAGANEIGNFCIAGHNFQNNIMFKNLKKLEMDDIIYITDRRNKKMKYDIYDIYTVLPKNVECLSQDTDGNREITLITCTNDSKKRIIVKAKAI